MLSHPLHSFVIPFIIICTATQAFIYFFGLYCSLQLNFYFWMEHNLIIAYRKRAGESYWAHRFGLERKNLFNTINSIISLGSSKNPITSTVTIFGPNAPNVETEVNQQEGLKPVEYDLPDETEKLMATNNRLKISTGSFWPKALYEPWNLSFLSHWHAFRDGRNRTCSFRF